MIPTARKELNSCRRLLWLCKRCWSRSEAPLRSAAAGLEACRPRDEASGERPYFLIRWGFPPSWGWRPPPRAGRRGTPGWTSTSGLRKPRGDRHRHTPWAPFPPGRAPGRRQVSETQRSRARRKDARRRVRLQTFKHKTQCKVGRAPTLWDVCQNKGFALVSDTVKTCTQTWWNRGGGDQGKRCLVHQKEQWSSSYKVHSGTKSSAKT